MSLARKYKNPKKLNGSDDVIHYLELMGDAGHIDALQKATAHGMTPVRSAASSAAPISSDVHDLPRRKGSPAVIVAPGHLKRNIVKRQYKKENKQGKAATIVGMKKAAWYGEFVEYGTSRQQAQPWLRKSYFEERRKVKTRFSDKLWKEVYRYMPSLKKMR